MDDELESLLREHYGRSAQTIHPDPGLAARLRSAGRPRRRRPRFPGRLALAAAAVVVAVVGLTWAEFGGGGDRAEPAAVQGPRVVITIAGTPTVAGSDEEVTGSVSPGGAVDLVVQSQRNSAWVTAATVTAEAGHYRARVSLAADTAALRVCTQAMPITCSPVLLLPQNTPSPIASSPAASLSSSPGPFTIPPRSTAPPPLSPLRRPRHTPSPAITGH